MTSPPEELQRITTETQGDKTILYLAKAVTDIYNSPDEGLAAIDVSDPTNPLQVGFYPMEMEGATVLMVEDLMVYLAEYSDGDLKLIDFSDPANPALLAHATVDGAGISASCLTEDYIVAASGYGDVLFFFARHGPPGGGASPTTITSRSPE